MSNKTPNKTLSSDCQVIKRCRRLSNRPRSGQNRACSAGHRLIQGHKASFRQEARIPEGPPPSQVWIALAHCDQWCLHLFWGPKIFLVLPKMWFDDVPPSRQNDLRKLFLKPNLTIRSNLDVDLKRYSWCQFGSAYNRAFMSNEHISAEIEISFQIAWSDDSDLNVRASNCHDDEKPCEGRHFIFEIPTQIEHIMSTRLQLKESPTWHKYTK